MQINVYLTLILPCLDRGIKANLLVLSFSYVLITIVVIMAFKIYFRNIWELLTF